MWTAVAYLAVVGAIAVAFLVALAVCYAVDVFRDWLGEPHTPSFQDGIDRARHNLAADAWWFSESPETMRLIDDLASGMGVGDARENWRLSRKASGEGDLAKAGGAK